MPHMFDYSTPMHFSQSSMQIPTYATKYSSRSNGSNRKSYPPKYMNTSKVSFMVQAREWWAICLWMCCQIVYNKRVLFISSNSFALKWLFFNRSAHPYLVRQPNQTPATHKFLYTHTHTSHSNVQTNFISTTIPTCNMMTRKQHKNVHPAWRQIAERLELVLLYAVSDCAMVISALRNSVGIDFIIYMMVCLCVCVCWNRLKHTPNHSASASAADSSCDEMRDAPKALYY